MFAIWQTVPQNSNACLKYSLRNNVPVIYVCLVQRAMSKIGNLYIVISLAITFTFSFWKWPGRYPFLTCTNVLCIKIHYAFLVLFLKFYLSPCIYLPEMCFSAACRQFLSFYFFFWLDYSFTIFFSYCCADLNVYVVILLRVNTLTCHKTRYKIYKNFAMTKIYIG